MKMKLTNLIALVLLSVSFHASAQESLNREIGLRGRNFDSYGLIYKFEKDSGVFRRYRAASASIYIGMMPITSSTSFGIYTAKEKRKALSPKLTLVRGWEWGIAASIHSYYRNEIALVAPSVGYIVGGQYRINKDLVASLEVVPSLSVNYIGGGILILGSLGGSQSHINFTVAHTFSSPERKPKKKR